MTARASLCSASWRRSYTTFAYTNLAVHGGETITTSFTVTNTGSRNGADVPQLYLTAAAGEQRMRLLGFERIELTPGESRQVTITADPRLLARFDAGDGRWHIAEGNHEIALATAADTPVLTADVTMEARAFGH
jgi:beta-glucosidase